MPESPLKWINSNSGILTILCALLIAKAAAVVVYGSTYDLMTDTIGRYIKNETATEVLSLREIELGKPLYYVFMRFDAGYYLEISKTGYSKEKFFAFPPGYPLVARFFSLFSLGKSMALVLVSNFFHIVSVILFYQIALLYLKREHALLSTALFAFYPYYLVSGTIAYSDSLFATFSLLSWITLERKAYGWSGALILAASLSRFQGMLLYPIYSLLLLWRERRAVLHSAKSLIALNASSLFVLYWLFVFIPASTELSYGMLQAKYWNGVFGMPFSALKILLSHVIVSINVPFMAFVVVAGLFSYCIRPEFAFYTLVFSLFYLSLSGASARYFGTIWPAFLYAGFIIKEASKKFPLDYLALIASAAVGVFLLVLQMNSLFIC